MVVRFDGGATSCRRHRQRHPHPRPCSFYFPSSCSSRPRRTWGRRLCRTRTGCTRTANLGFKIFLKKEKVGKRPFRGRRRENFPSYLSSLFFAILRHFSHPYMKRSIIHLSVRLELTSYSTQAMGYGDNISHEEREERRRRRIFRRHFLPSSSSFLSGCVGVGGGRGAHAIYPDCF